MSKIILKDSNDDLTLKRGEESIGVYTTLAQNIDRISTIDDVVAAALVDLDKRLKALESSSES